MMGFLFCLLRLMLVRLLVVLVPLHLRLLAGF
jgi:hypothetical protein